MSLTVRHIIPVLGAAWVAAFAQAAVHTFVADGGDWSDPKNWRPEAPAEWTASHTGIVANATAIMDAPLGAKDNAPTIIIGEDGVCELTQNNGRDFNLHTPFILRGGNLVFSPERTAGWARILVWGGIAVEEDSTLTLLANHIIFEGPFSGNASLTLAGLNPVVGGELNHGPFLKADNSGFTGDLHIRTRVFVKNASQLGAGNVIVHAGGFLDLDGHVDKTRPITLNGGALRAMGDYGFRSDIFVAADSFLDTTAGRLGVGGNISGPGKITVGCDLPGGARAGRGTVGLRGDNRAWTGGLVIRHPYASVSSMIEGPNAFPNGPVSLPNEGTCQLYFSHGFTTTHDFTGPVFLYIGHGSTGTFTINGATFSPSALPDSAGASTLFGNLSLANATLRMKIVGAKNHDQLILYHGGVDVFNFGENAKKTISGGSDIALYNFR